MTRIRLAALIGLALGVVAFAVVLRRPSAMTPKGTAVDTGDPLVPSSAAKRDGKMQPQRTGADAPRNSAGVGTRSRGEGESSGTTLLGSVVAPTQASLSVRVPTRIRQVFAREGDTVSAGQPLVDLDDTEIAAQEQAARAGENAAEAQVKKARAGLSAQQAKASADVDTAQGALQQARTRLQQAILARQAAADEQKSDLRAALEGVQKAQVGLDRARDTLRGLEELSKVGGVSRSDLEGARTQERLAQTDLESAQAQVDRVRAGSGGLPYRVAVAQKDVDAAQSGVQQARDALATAKEGGRQAVKVAEQDVHAARAALDQATTSLASARTARIQSRLLSPIAGLVTAVGARPGETAQPGVALATIISLAGLRVEALVPARLLPLFRAGESARVSVDTVPGRFFGAVVQEIARIAEPDGRNFRVKFRLLDTPPLLPGQTARIRVQTSR